MRKLKKEFFVFRIVGDTDLVQLMMKDGIEDNAGLVNLLLHGESFMRSRAT